MADTKNPNPCPLRMIMNKSKDAKWSEADVKVFIREKMVPIRASVALFEVLASEKSLDVPSDVRAEVRRALAHVLAACENINTVLAKVPQSIRAEILVKCSGKPGRKASEGYAD